MATAASRAAASEEEREEDSFSPAVIQEEEQKLMQGVVDPELDARTLRAMRRSGVTRHAWPAAARALKRFVRPCFEQVRPKDESRSPAEEEETQRVIDEAVKSIQDMIDAFENAPFTLQRLCEILEAPSPQFRTVESLRKGLTTVLSVVTTTKPVSLKEIARLREEKSRVDLRSRLPPASHIGKAFASSVPGRSAPTEDLVNEIWPREIPKDVMMTESEAHMSAVVTDHAKRGSPEEEETAEEANPMRKKRREQEEEQGSDS